MEAAVLVRSALLRNLLSDLEQPLDPTRTAAISQQLVENGLLTAGPDGAQGGLWAPVTELQGKLVETMLKHLTKGEAVFRPGVAALLGLVCRHVPARAFLASYGDWAAALLEVVRRDQGAAPRAAALRALGELFSRVRELLEVPGVRRDASSIAGRTLQVATPLLTDADCQVSALAAVRAVLQALPTVARNHTTPLERSLAGLMAAPASPPVVRRDAAVALALLPRAAADDAAAWAALIRRVLLSLHTAIDLLLYYGGGISGGGGGAAGGVAPDGGLGERAREHLEAVGQGVADAEGLLGSLGFVSGAGGAGGVGGGSGAVAAAPRPDVTLTVEVTSALLHCLVTLVGRGSTSPVPVPSHAILLLVMRMLKLDAAVLLAPGRVAPSASAQSEVLVLLPDVAISAWELLDLTARVVRSCMMPLMALVCRLLAEHLRRIKAGGAGGLAVTMPAAVRTSLYRTTITVLRVGGFAAGRYLAAEVTGMLVTELYGLSATQQQEQQSKAALYGGAAAGMGKAVRTPAAMAAVPSVKKAKTAGAVAGGPLAAFDAATAAAAAAAAAPVAAPADVEAQKAAMEVAEALLQVYGPALPSDLRGQLDALSYHMAAVLAEAAYRVAKERGAAAAARAADVAVLRVAATRTLVASLAAPWPSRHPFLSEGLQLLSTGASGAGGVALAEACSEGLLALEALLRPRSAPPLGAGRAGGSAAGGAAAVDTAQGLQLPRPRLWSMFDPVQPQLPPPAVGTAAAAAAATAPMSVRATAAPAAEAPSAQAAVQLAAEEAAATAAGSQAMEKGGVGEGKRAAQATRNSAAATEPAAPVPTPKSGGKEKTAAAKDKAVRSGIRKTPTAPASSAAATGHASEPPGKRRKGEDGKTAAAAAAEIKGRGGARAPPAAVPPVAATPVAAPAAPLTAAAAAASGAASAPRAAPAAPAAVVFGDESEDSEGSLPEIDSGNDSGDSDEE